MNNDNTTRESPVQHLNMFQSSLCRLSISAFVDPVLRGFPDGICSYPPFCILVGKLTGARLHMRLKPLLLRCCNWRLCTSSCSRRIQARVDGHDEAAHVSSINNGRNETGVTSNLTYLDVHQCLIAPTLLYFPNAASS